MLKESGNYLSNFNNFSFPPFFIKMNGFNHLKNNLFTNALILKKCNFSNKNSKQMEVLFFTVRVTRILSIVKNNTFEVGQCMRGLQEIQRSNVAKKLC